MQKYDLKSQLQTFVRETGQKKTFTKWSNAFFKHTLYKLQAEKSADSHYVWMTMIQNLSSCTDDLIPYLATRIFIQEEFSLQYSLVINYF